LRVGRGREEKKRKGGRKVKTSMTLLQPLQCLSDANVRKRREAKKKKRGKKKEGEIYVAMRTFAG